MKNSYPSSFVSFGKLNRRPVGCKSFSIVFDSMAYLDGSHMFYENESHLMPSLELGMFLRVISKEWVTGYKIGKHDNIRDSQV